MVSGALRQRLKYRSAPQATPLAASAVARSARRGGIVQLDRHRISVRASAPDTKSHAFQVPPIVQPDMTAFIETMAAGRSRLPGRLATPAVHSEPEEPPPRNLISGITSKKAMPVYNIELSRLF
jgi:hypothetical protein